MFFSEVIRFTLPSITSAAFQELRQHVASQGVKNQYFGYTLSNQGFPLPQKKNQLCWVIRVLTLLFPFTIDQLVYFDIQSGPKMSI
jgi:hypothetical protein